MKGKVILVQAMKTYSGSRAIVPFIIDLHHTAHGKYTMHGTTGKTICDWLTKHKCLEQELMYGSLVSVFSEPWEYITHTETRDGY